MSSWWQFGEGSGQFGTDLALYQIKCAFCNEAGNFELTHRETKQKPNSRKVLNFDTYKCGNCANFVMIFWSPSEDRVSGHGLHDYIATPWPKGLRDGEDYWPTAARRHWKQAHSNLNNSNYDAAALMARSALQVITRDKGATGNTLYEEIESLATSGVLSPTIKDWSHEVRELGNPVAHANPDDDETSAEDAEDIVKFLDFLLKYLYDLPKQINDYRSRRNPQEEDEE